MSCQLHVYPWMTELVESTKYWPPFKEGTSDFKEVTFCSADLFKSFILNTCVSSGDICTKL